MPCVGRHRLRIAAEERIAPEKVVGRADEKLAVAGIAGVVPEAAVHVVRRGIEPDFAREVVILDLCGNRQLDVRILRYRNRVVARAQACGGRRDLAIGSGIVGRDHVHLPERAVGHECRSLALVGGVVARLACAADGRLQHVRRSRVRRIVVVEVPLRHKPSLHLKRRA